MTRFEVGDRIVGRNGLGVISHVYGRRFWQRRRYVIGWDDGCISPAEPHHRIEHAEPCSANYDRKARG